LPGQACSSRAMTRGRFDVGGMCPGSLTACAAWCGTPPLNLKRRLAGARSSTLCGNVLRLTRTPVKLCRSPALSTEKRNTPLCHTGVIRSTEFLIASKISATGNAAVQIELPAPEEIDQARMPAKTAQLMPRGMPKTPMRHVGWKPARPNPPRRTPDPARPASWPVDPRSRARAIFPRTARRLMQKLRAAELD
jgi:hypothetical protein